MGLPEGALEEQEQHRGGDQDGDAPRHLGSAGQG